MPQQLKTQYMFDFGIKDIIDVFLVALMLYYIYRLMKESRSLKRLHRHHSICAGVALC